MPLFRRTNAASKRKTDDIGSFGRLALTCVAAGCIAFAPAFSADAPTTADSSAVTSQTPALLLDNVDVLSSASLSTTTPVTIGKGESWAVPAEGGMHPVVTIGVPDTADLGRERPMMISTIEQLSRAMPGTEFRLRVILSADGNAQLNIVKPDFMFAPAGADAVWRREGIDSYRIATRKSASAKEAGKSVGSVLVTLKSRDDLQDIGDLKSKTVAAGLPDSVPGWLAALGEVQKAGYDPDEFFGKSEFLFEYYPEILASLWGGKADVAVLPTCMLEALEKDGLVATDQLKVLHDKSDEALACKRSTDLYPDLSLVGFSWTPEKMARDVTVALMSQKTDAPYEWLSYVSHANVDELFRDLKAGPYSYLRDFSLKALYARHTVAFWAVGAILLSLVFYGALLQILVRRRTRELSETLEQQRRMEVEAREHRRRLGHLERRNIVNQMSGMIAHEINSPVGAICNFKAILDLLLSDESRRDANIRVALDGIESEAQRIAGIVGRVRSYAKKQKHAHKQCDLVDISKRAVRAFYVSSPAKAVIQERYEVESAPLLGDSLELELLVLNLIRNASEVEPQKGGRVHVKVTVRHGDDGRFCVEVQDNGKTLTDEELERLTKMMQSVKPEGLGMGLSIVRGIADSHGAELDFRRGDTCGLKVTVTFEAVADNSESPTIPNETKEAT